VANHKLRIGVHIPSDIAGEIVDYAQANSQEEICGLLIGKFKESKGEVFARVVSQVPVKNVYPDPTYGFTMDPEESLRQFESCHKAGLHIVGCYHSHPLWSCSPSVIDFGSANEEYFWLIYGGADGQLSISYYKCGEPWFLPIRNVPVGRIWKTKNRASDSYASLGAVESEASWLLAWQTFDLTGSL